MGVIKRKEGEKEEEGEAARAADAGAKNARNRCGLSPADPCPSQDHAQEIRPVSGLTSEQADGLFAGPPSHALAQW